MGGSVIFFSRRTVDGRRDCRDSRRYIECKKKKKKRLKWEEPVGCRHRKLSFDHIRDSWSTGAMNLTRPWSAPGGFLAFTDEQTKE